MAIYLCEVPPAQMETVAKKVVLLAGYENLLGYSVEVLLNTSSILDLVKVSGESSLEAVLEQIEEKHPDVVVICQPDWSSSAHWPARLIERQARLKVIMVNLENNSVDVFSKQRVLIRQGSDLLSIVEGCPSQYCTLE